MTFKIHPGTEPFENEDYLLANVGRQDSNFQYLYFRIIKIINSKKGLQGIIFTFNNLKKDYRE